jgi:hypothetical protein
MDLEMNPTEEPDELEEKMEKEDELEQTSVLPMHWKVGGGTDHPLLVVPDCSLQPSVSEGIL